MICRLRFKLLLAVVVISVVHAFGTLAQDSIDTPYKSSLPQIQADKVAIYIEDLYSGEVLLDVNGEEPMVPASVTKLVTAATLIHKNGINRRYATKVVASGKIDKEGVLNGNIIVYASGDPTIESAYFEKYKGFADSVAVAAKRLGISKVKGKVIVDCPKWMCEPIPSGWSKDDVNHPYGADHHAANYADNRFLLSYRSEDNYTVTPATPDVTFRAVKGKGGVSRNPGETAYNVCHQGRKPLSATLANPLPESSLRNAIENCLSKQEILIDGDSISPSKQTKEIYCHESPTVGDILKSLLLRSDNTMAEAMLRFAWPGLSRCDAAQRELETWKALGVNMNDVALEDGSGLSRKNRLTAYALADLLVWMIGNEPDFNQFIDMLPRAGRSGTLKSFLKGTPLENRLWAKTGSMSGVQSYAGYLVNEQGKPTHVVVIMINGFKCDRAKLKSDLTNLLVTTLTPPPATESFDVFD